MPLVGIGWIQQSKPVFPIALLSGANLIFADALVGDTMPIPESQLSRWSDHGSQDSSKRTHEAIRRGLSAYQWPSGMSYDFYLQGSYANDTNIRGDSDVDVVLELTSSIRYDSSALSKYDQSRIESSFSPATCDWNDLRRETLKALEAAFGQRMVAQGNKSVKLRADPPRLASDVVICMGYRRYTNPYSYVDGITFQALQDKRWIVNHPKEHQKNGAAKSRRAWDRYKRTVRMFKNARNQLVDSGRIRADLAPSYFVECLLYNAPDWAFKSSFQETYRATVNWIVQNNLDRLVCQNEQQWLFGPSPEQWSVKNAKDLGTQLVSLWNSW